MAAPVGVTSSPCTPLMCSGRWYASAMADVAGGTAKYYVVKKGDTLTKIANRYGVTRTQLMRWNNRITDPDYIQAGWQIRVG